MIGYDGCSNLSSDRGIAFSFKPVQSNLTPECLTVHNLFRAAQNPQAATSRQHAPARADAVAVAVVAAAKLLLRTPAMTRPLLKRKILLQHQHSQTRLLKPRPTLQFPLQRMP